MKTELLYQIDPYRSQMQARVLEILPEPAGRLRVVLDRSVFCPAGGAGRASKRGGSRGRPTDQGWLSWINESGPAQPQARVTQVLFIEGEIWHYLEPVQPGNLPLLQVGQSVVGILDWERRYRTMRVQTAAGLLRFALEQLANPGLVLLRADYYGDAPYLVFEGSNLPDLALLEQTVTRLIEAGSRLDWQPTSLSLEGFGKLDMQDDPTTLAGISLVLLRITKEVGPLHLSGEVWADLGQLKISFRLD